MRNPIGLPGVLLLVGIAASAAPVPARADGTSVPDGPHRAHAAYPQAINGNNLTGLTAIFTQDVVYLPPNEPAVVGRTAVRAWAEASLKAYRIHDHKTELEFAVAADRAFERYPYRQNDSPVAGGAAVTDTGEGLIVYHDDADGRSRVAPDAWNSDSPAKAP